MTTKKKKVVLLSGGNPQIAKGYGDAPVQEYYASLSDWKRETGRKIDRIIVRVVPKVRKAVKWNSPLYGVEGSGWFLGIHVFARYIKVAFFKGAALTPLPPDPSKDKYTRYLNVHEGQLDEAQFASWVKQAAALPGWDDSVKKTAKSASKARAVTTWQEETLERMRKLIFSVDKKIVEEIKYRGVPVWSLDGMITTGEMYKKVVKLTFMHGASLKDPAGLFNSSMEGSTRRAIDISEGEKVDAAAFKALVKEAIAANRLRKKK